MAALGFEKLEKSDDDSLKALHYILDASIRGLVH